MVGYAGRLVVEKGIFELLKAAQRNPHLEFHFAGWGKLKNEIVASKLANVHFHGLLNGQKLYEFYASCDCITQLSVVRRNRVSEWQDVFGLSVAEAICFGCIPFISNLPAPSKVFTRLSPENLMLAKIEDGKFDPQEIDSVLRKIKKKNRDIFKVPELISNEYNEKLWKNLISAKR